LTSYGHVIGNTTMTSGIHTIVRKGGHLEGGADPRREGVAVGD
jgi:gamma-glutamyltranspeptidase/glutathione hydrolase